MTAIKEPDDAEPFYFGAESIEFTGAIDDRGEPQFAKGGPIGDHMLPITLDISACKCADEIQHLRLAVISLSAVLRAVRGRVAARPTKDMIDRALGKYGE